MSGHSLKTWLFGAAVSTAAALVALTPARADEVWRLKDAVFSDGATLTGTFSIDTYGYFDAFDLHTTASQTFPAKNYTTGASDYIDNAKTAINLYFGLPAPGNGVISLNLTFADPLTMGSPHNDLILAGASTESITNYSDSSQDLSRALVSGYAATPEPGTWALMLLGFATVGGAVRRRASAFA